VPPFSVGVFEECGGVGQLAHVEGELAHFLLAAFVLGGDGEGDVGAWAGGYGDVAAVAFLGEGPAGHGEADFVDGHAWDADADGVLVACVEHVHEGGGDGG